MRAWSSATTSAFTVRVHGAGGDVCACALAAAISTTSAVQQDENSDGHRLDRVLVFIKIFTSSNRGVIGSC